MNTHHKENPLGSAKSPWIRPHFREEKTLFEILAQVENYGLGRKVQFRTDVDPYVPLDQVDKVNTNWQMQEGEIMSEYDDSTRVFDKNQEEEIEGAQNPYEVTASQNLARANSTFWTISRVFPDYYAPGIEYGYACGFLTINGIEIPGERLIEHSHKPGWLLIPKIYEKHLISNKIDVDQKTGEITNDYVFENPTVEPEITTKKLYSNLPPMVRLQSIEKQKAVNENNRENRVPMMRNVVRRGSLDDLNQVTLLENLHDKQRDRFY